VRAFLFAAFWNADQAIVSASLDISIRASAAPRHPRWRV